MSFVFDVFRFSIPCDLRCKFSKYHKCSFSRNSIRCVLRPDFSHWYLLPVCISPAQRQSRTPCPLLALRSVNGIHCHKRVSAKVMLLPGMAHAHGACEGDSVWAGRHGCGLIYTEHTVELVEAAVVAAAAASAAAGSGRRHSAGMEYEHESQYVHVVGRQAAFEE